MSSSIAALYGKGIFTTIAIRRGEPLFWDKHWTRLGCDAAKVGVDLSGFPEKRVFDELKNEIATSGITDGRARITFSDERSGDIWPLESSENTAMSILVGERRQLPAKFSITASPYRVNTYSPLVGVKSCNYLENLLGIGEAKSRGFHEALRINYLGELTGGCMSNLFWLKYGKLWTPHLDTGCLPGTTREYILENLECEETRQPIDTLINAEAIFMTSAGLGVVRVHDLDGLAFNEIDHPILHLLK
ncbi:MAG TPA: aminotransferase class IV [Pyrinomonadaceae bacterium]|nr:aminotransferase class IV [Pyrinomonadaceae bacterium]